MLFLFCFASMITSLLGISMLGSCQVWPWMFTDSCLTYKCTSLYNGTLCLSIVVSDKSQKLTIYMRLTRFFHVPGLKSLIFLNSWWEIPAAGMIWITYDLFIFSTLSHQSRKGRSWPNQLMTFHSSKCSHRLLGGSQLFHWCYLRQQDSWHCFVT